MELPSWRSSSDVSGVSGRLIVTFDLGLMGEMVEFESAPLSTMLLLVTLTGGVGVLNLTAGGVGVLTLFARASSLVRV